MIITRDDGSVRVISLNDPESSNSLSERLARALQTALADAATDKRVRAVVLTAEGNVFCAGGNLKDLLAVQGDRGDYVARVMDQVYNPLVDQLAVFPLPLVVAMNGPAIGAGVGLALNADFVLMSGEAYFTLPFVPKLGIVPDLGSGWLLTQALGYRKILALALTGEPLRAAEARELGLVSRVCESDEVVNQAIQLANQLGTLARNAVSRTKRLLRSAETMNLKDYVILERLLQIDSFRDSAVAEGLAAFAERRAPDFT